MPPPRTNERPGSLVWGAPSDGIGWCSGDARPWCAGVQSGWMLVGATLDAPQGPARANGHARSGSTRSRACGRGPRAPRRGIGIAPSARGTAGTAASVACSREWLPSTSSAPSCGRYRGPVTTQVLRFSFAKSASPGSLRRLFRIFAPLDDWIGSIRDVLRTHATVWVHSAMFWRRAVTVRAAFPIFRTPRGPDQPRRTLFTVQTPR